MRHARWCAARSLAGAAVLSIVVAGCAGSRGGVSAAAIVPTLDPSTSSTSVGSTSQTPASITSSAPRLPTSTAASSLMPSPAQSATGDAAPAAGLSPDALPKPSIAPAPAPRAATTASLRLLPKFIAFPERRKDEMSAYSLRHYGASSWRLSPSMIVLHFTETDTASSARNAFANDSSNLGELPGTCAHFIVAQNGDVWQIVPTSVRCRHTIGLNDRAVGIEIVQRSYGNGARWADRQILARSAQIGAVLALVRSLQRQYGIRASNVIGHAMANDASQFRDLQGWRNDHTDWLSQDVLELRRRLSVMR